MDRKEAKKLNVGDRICIWEGSPDACTGTVVEIGYNAVKTEWDDGQTGVIHLNDHRNVVRWCGEPIVPLPRARTEAQR